MPIDFPATPSDRSRRAEVVLALLALAVAAVIQLRSAWPGLSGDATDRQEIFTAISIRALATDGLQFDYPTPVLGRPWKLPAELGLYPNAAAGAARLTGASVEKSGRMVALVFFYLGLPAVYLLARRFGANRAGSLLAVAFWLISPVGLAQAAALTSTTTAVTLSAWWLWFFLQGIGAPALRHWLATALLGAIAAPAAGATFLPFALAALIFWLPEQRRSRRPVSVAISVAAGLVPALVAAVTWTHHANQLKAESPYAAFLDSSEMWAAAFGTWAQRADSDFWILFVGDFFTSLVTPLAALLLLVFTSLNPQRTKAPLIPLLLVIPTCLAVFLPLYDGQPRELGPAILLACILVAALVGDLLRGNGVVLWVAAVLVFLAQTQLKVTSTEELHSPLPDAAELAQSVAQATRPTDLVVTSGQDWDLLFAYQVNRRAVLVPAGRETDLPALTRAVGDRRDWHVGAVVLTGRYRAEPAHVAELQRLFGLGEKPVLQTSASDVFFPADAEADARTRLTASGHTVLLRRDPSSAPAAPPPPAPATAPKRAPVAAAGALPPFTMMSPQPNRSSVPYDLVAHKIDGVPCFFAHAPTTLEFDLPSGGTQLVMEFFMAEGSYTGKGDTDGADVVASIHHRDGSLEELFRRHLDPVNRRGDRQVQIASVVFKGTPGSILVVQSLPGPKMRANYDWVYFRRIEIK